MVTDHAEYSFIVVLSLLWEELNDDSYLRFGFDNSFSFWECKDIGFVREDLESGGLVTIVDNVQKSVGCLFLLNFSKVDGGSGEGDLVAKAFT